MNVDAAILPRPGAARQHALIDQPGDEFDGAKFADQRGIEGDFVDAVHDLARRRRRRLPHQRIDLHHEHILGRRGAEKRKDHRIAEIAAVPIRHAVDLDRAKQYRQAGRGHHRVGGDFFARKNTHAAGLHIGRRNKELQSGIGAQRVEIDEALDQILQRIDVEGIDVVGREIARHRIEPGLHRRAFERRERQQALHHLALQRRQIAGADAARQKSASRFFASSRPPRMRPSASITAFIAPADVPEIPSMASRSSLKSCSSTPQVNAPGRRRLAAPD